jgi:hypothetical protein
VNLRRLLLAHAVVTCAAGVVLIVVPEVIPAAVGIDPDSTDYLLCYLLGAAELALAFLSYRARTLTDVAALRLVSAVLIAFHASTAAVEVYAIAQGASAAIWVNVLVRAIVMALFVRYGLQRPAVHAS